MAFAPASSHAVATPVAGVHAHELAAASVPAAVTGAVLAVGPAVWSANIVRVPGVLVAAAVSAIVLVYLLAQVGIRIATWLLTPQLTEAMSAGSLRTA